MVNSQPEKALSKTQLALISMYHGDLKSAWDMLIRCLDISQKSQEWRAVAQNLASSGAVLLRFGYPERACEVWGSASWIREYTRSVLLPCEQAELDAWISDATSMLGPDKVQAAWKLGEGRDNPGSVARATQYLAAAI